MPKDFADQPDRASQQASRNASRERTLGAHSACGWSGSICWRRCRAMRPRSSWRGVCATGPRGSRAWSMHAVMCRFGVISWASLAQWSRGAWASLPSALFGVDVISRFGAMTLDVICPLGCGPVLYPCSHWSLPRMSGCYLTASWCRCERSRAPMPTAAEAGGTHRHGRSATSIESLTDGLGWLLPQV